MCTIKPFVEPAATGGRKYFRYRKVTFEDGTQGRALETRYTWASARRPCEGPRGGRAYQTFYRTAYWAEGRFWRMANVPTPEGWENRLVPIDGPAGGGHTTTSRTSSTARPTPSGLATAI